MENLTTTTLEPYAPFPMWQDLGQEWCKIDNAWDSSWITMPTPGGLAILCRVTQQISGPGAGTIEKTPLTWGELDVPSNPA